MNATYIFNKLVEEAKSLSTNTRTSFMSPGKQRVNTADLTTAGNHSFSFQ